MPRKKEKKIALVKVQKTSKSHCMCKLLPYHYKILHNGNEQGRVKYSNGDEKAKNSVFCPFFFKVCRALKIFSIRH